MRGVPGRRGAGGVNAPSRAGVLCRRVGIASCERLHVAVPDSLVCFRCLEFRSLGECGRMHNAECLILNSQLDYGLSRKGRKDRKEHQIDVNSPIG